MKSYVLNLVTLLVTISCGIENDRERIRSNENLVDTLQSQLEEIVNKHMQTALNDTLINSFSIGVHNQGYAYTFHLGGLTQGRNDSPNDNTIYEIASVTKTFTGTLTAKAILDGKLNLDDDIRKYLPQPYPNLEYEGHPIRIQHLLTHTSGLPSGILGMPNVERDLNEIEFNKAYLKFENQATRSDFFKHLSKVSIKEIPGSKFNYSNPGSNLMGYILGKVYDKPFQKLIEEDILSKAKMNNTYFRVPEKERYRIANGYLLDMPAPETKLSETLWGAEGALKSTITDMLNYIDFQFKEIDLVKESHRKIYEIDKDYWIGYYWWSIENQNHDLHLRHDGGITRGKTVLVIYPEQKIGICVFTNQSSMTIINTLSELTYNIYNDLKELNK
ncbi:MAG: serine hydrolase domain-containing protein [Bacteroidota bacterium]